MSKQQLLRWCLEQMDRYEQKYTPQEQFDRMVVQGVIDKDGKVLLCGDDDSEVSNGQDKKAEKEPDTRL